MQKIACLFSFKESNWVSCQKIVFNLLKSYRAISNLDLKNFNFSESLSTQADLENLISEIVKFNPDVISILDHRPHPITLLQIIAREFKDKKKPKILIHVFGDFTLYYTQWAKCEDFLKGFEVEFFVASDRQKVFLDNLLNSNQSVVCPFPVDDKEFHFDPKLRIKQRAEWKLTDQDVVFLFTGRLSRQKRIRTLIKEFAAVFEKTPNAHLFFYGNPDNIGDPFLGSLDMEGEYFRSFYRIYEGMPQQLKDQIHFMGSVPNNELHKVYQGADFLVNLSVHNDEDYGMSVAESHFCGLPSILTSWGGLASFQYETLPKASKFVPVKIGDRAKLISLTKTREALSNCFHDSHPVEREALALAAKEKFGIERSAKIINKTIMHQTLPFTGFSPLFHTMFEANFVASFTSPYVTTTGKIKNLYRELYSAYVRNH